MINSLQILVYSPLYERLIFPQNALIMANFLIELTQFDLIPTEFLDEWAFNKPDEEEVPFNQSFEACDIESTLMAYNAGFLIWFLFANLALVVPYVLVFIGSKRCCTCGCCKNLQQNMRSYLFCNGIMRLFIQGFFEMFLLAALNMITADWETGLRDVWYSNLLAYSIVGISLILVAAAPIAYRLCIKRWNNDEFIANYGTYLADLNTNYKLYSYQSIVLVYPVLFLVRRVAFILAVLTMGE